MSKSKGIPQDRIKVQFLRPKRKINRRDLLNLFLPPALTKGLRKKLGNSSLSEGEIARCRECSSVIGSRAMIERLQVILQTMSCSLASQLELCSTCKAKQPSLGRATLEQTTSQARKIGSLEEG